MSEHIKIPFDDMVNDHTKKELSKIVEAAKGLEWFRAKDIGGISGSQHSRYLKLLVDRGVLQDRQHPIQRTWRQYKLNQPHP